MVSPTEGWTVLFKAASESFLSGRFLPWFFIAGLNIVFYELAVADGFSIIAELQALDDFDQAIVLLLFLATIGGIAAISTAAGDFILAFFDARVDPRLKHAIGMMRAEEAKSAHFLTDLDISQTSVLNMGMLFFGLYLTFIVQALAFFAWEEAAWLSLSCVGALFFFVTMTWWLAKNQAKELNWEMRWLFAKIPDLIDTSAKNTQVVGGGNSKDDSDRPRIDIFEEVEPLPTSKILHFVASIRSGFLFFPLLAIVVFFALNLWVANGAWTASTPRTATILAINDVYRLTGPDRGKGGGGLARTRALRAKLETAHPDMLMLHAGDFLSPSLLGKTYKGEHMVDLMNLLDGDPRAGITDTRLFVVLGNHEFDDTHCTKKGPLAQRIRESDFTYIASNLEFQKAELAGDKCAGLHGISASPAGEKIVRYKIIKSGDLRIGIYGLTILDDKYKIIASDPVTESCKMVRELRRQRVDAVVALTHLDRDTDLALLGLDPDGTPRSHPLCVEYPDVIVGGHDHTRMALPANGYPRIFKADADAVSAYQIVLTVDKRRNVSVKGINVALSPMDETDPLVQGRAAGWFKRHDERFCQAACVGLTGVELEKCGRLVAGGACLQQKVANLASELDAEEIKNRSQETGFGNWLSDRLREVSKAEVAIFNAGGIRLNYDIQSASVVSRRHIVEMFPFSNTMVVADVPASQVWKAIDRGFSSPGEGSWLHFSGLAAKRASNGKLEKLALQSKDGRWIELTKSSKRTVSVASNAFVLANGDKHGFKLCSLKTKYCFAEIIEKFGPRWPSQYDNDPAKLVQTMMIRDAGDAGLKFEKDNRICGQNQNSCLIDGLTLSK